MVDWKKFLWDIPLAEIKAKFNVGHAGLVNLHFEDHHYHFHFSDPEAAKKFLDMEITPELEEKSKKEAEKRLSPIGDSLNAIPEESMKDVVLSTSIATATTYPFLKKL
jgi:hypothetical protein